MVDHTAPMDTVEVTAFVSFLFPVSYLFAFSRIASSVPFSVISFIPGWRVMALTFRFQTSRRGSVTGRRSFAPGLTFSLINGLTCWTLRLRRFSFIRKSTFRGHIRLALTVRQSGLRPFWRRRQITSLLIFKWVTRLLTQKLSLITFNCRGRFSGLGSRGNRGIVQNFTVHGETRRVLVTRGLKVGGRGRQNRILISSS